MASKTSFETGVVAALSAYILLTDVSMNFGNTYPFKRLILLVLQSGYYCIPFSSKLQLHLQTLIVNFL